jgi:hypothetical protein
MHKTTAAGLGKMLILPSSSPSSLLKKVVMPIGLAGRQKQLPPSIPLPGSCMYLPQCTQALVNVDSFSQHSPLAVAIFHAFTASQVNKRQFPIAHSAVVIAARVCKASRGFVSGYKSCKLQLQASVATIHAAALHSNCNPGGLESACMVWYPHKLTVRHTIGLTATQPKATAC